MRDRRRFGPGPYLLGLRRLEEREGFPFDVPAVEQVERLRLTERVTLLAGDNGSGKSTLIEAFAQAIGFAEEGGELERLGERPAVPHSVLDGALAHLECVREALVPAGDHTLVVGRVIGGGAAEHGRPLLYYRGGYADPDSL